MKKRGQLAVFEANSSWYEWWFGEKDEARAALEEVVARIERVAVHRLARRPLGAPASRGDKLRMKSLSVS